MSAKSPFPVIGVASVCSVLVWVTLVHLLSGAAPPEILICTILLSLVLFVVISIFGLMLRDTIRQRGMFGINFKRVACPQCGAHLFRGITPRSWKEICYDGWTCHECGIELSQWGRPWKEQNTLAKWNVLRAVEGSEQRRKRSQTHDERIHNVNDQTQRGDVS